MSTVRRQFSDTVSIRHYDNITVFCCRLLNKNLDNFKVSYKRKSNNARMFGKFSTSRKCSYKLSVKFDLGKEKPVGVENKEFSDF